MIYKSPDTKEQYWGIVDKYWKDIFFIINLYLPTFQKQWITGEKLDKTLGDYILELKDTRNPRLVRVFSAALWNIPQEVPFNEIPSWTQFYDLCTMEYRLYEDKEEDIINND